MGIKGVARNAEKNLKTYTSITRRQRKAKLGDKMVSTIDSLGNWRLSMETRAIRFHSKKPTSLEAAVFVLIIQQLNIKSQTFTVALIRISFVIIALASLITPPNSIRRHRTMMTTI